MKKIIIVFIFICFAKTANSQSRHIDSLKKLLTTLPNDTQKVNILIDIGFDSFGSDPDLTIECGQEAIKISEKINSPKHLANAYSILALGYSIKNDYRSALMIYEKALVIREKLNDKTGVSKMLGNIGNVYWNLADYPKALDYQLKSLKLKEETGNKQGVANCLGNIANIYSSLGQTDKALQYNLECIKIGEELGNKKSVALCYCNIGTIYQANKDYKTALDYFLKALKASQEMNDKLSIGQELGNIGLCYIELNDHKLASDYLQKSLDIRNALGDRLGIASVYNHMAEMNVREKKYAAAENNYLVSLNISKELGLEAREKDVLLGLSQLYEKEGKALLSLQYYKKYISLRDTLTNLDNEKLIIQKQLAYDYDKKAIADSLKTSEEKKISSVLLQQEKTQKNVLYGGLVLVLLFSGFIFNRFKITQKQKIIIEEKEKETQKQKHLIEEKQKEIVDSINYAKRLQDAILPQVSFIKESFAKLNADVFVFYQQKDIVAGDFYFFEETNEHLFIAAADCTGHGVPGAMVSVVCSNALTRSVKEFGLTDPGKILDKTTEFVLDTFSRSLGQVKDGMDISLLSVHKKNKTISWAGANSDLWYIEGELNGSKNVTELKANKQPIGQSDDPKPFVTHQLEFKAGTIFYLITDGYADQFGGTNGKKLKSKNFKLFLNSINGQPLSEQADVITKNFNGWKGTYEQVDDVCVIGIKL